MRIDIRKEEIFFSRKNRLGILVTNNPLIDKINRYRKLSCLFQKLPHNIWFCGRFFIKTWKMITREQIYNEDFC